ncbi:MAG TPA: DUF2283 domain-containing protein [Rhodocyclaceae bacterium]|jgi:uncharacterized protein YuzE|nr:DUF2283 domain-containing protein [Rhodocyclaceae bacterium]
MKLEFDPIADAAYLELQAGEVVVSREIEAGIIADFDAEGHIVGIEILHVSKRGTAPVPLRDAA